MYGSGKAYLTYALNQKGDLVHVDSVPNGNECGCFCPHCRSALCAKNGGNGEKMIHHFAHLSGADCVGAVESALHKMAKDILLKSKCVCLPDRLDGQKGELHHFDRVEVEFFDKNTRLKPDCVGYNDNKSLWVEFKRTHAVDSKKKGKIISAHIDCIEIDLNACNLDPIELKEFITNSTERRIWIRDLSIQKRLAGHASGTSYCDRYDIEDVRRQLKRTFAKDEKGNLVNLEDDKFNLNEHSYYCLACGKELTVDVEKDGAYGFIHVDDINNCRDDYYLYEAAKEIIYDRFYSSDEFTICVPQYKICKENTNCHFYNEEECMKENNIPYNLKEHGYVECVKDYSVPNIQNSCDLVIKQKESFDNAIILNVHTEDYNSDNFLTDYRIIELEVHDEYSLMCLQNKPIGKYESLFHNFMRNSQETVLCSEIDRGIMKFELFSSGKYHLGIGYCGDINKRKRSTVYEMVFVNEVSNYSDARVYALSRCLSLKKKACYCELCFYSAEINSYGMKETICKLYKTRETPHYPINATYMDCPHFSLNRILLSNIERECKDIVVIERNYESK